MVLTTDDLDLALAAFSAGVRPVLDRDWSVRAGTLDWDCWHTAEHIGDCLLSYAGQIVAQPDGRYVRFLAKADAGASPAELLEFGEAGGRILAATVRCASPTVRAYHPSGLADLVGFTGMACVEVLLHGQDIATGLDVSLDPPRDLCQRILGRTFPHIVAEVADLDPWTGLCWYTGRVVIPDRPAPDRWHWQASPLDAAS